MNRTTQQERIAVRIDSSQSGVAGCIPSRIHPDGNTLLMEIIFETQSELEIGF